MRRVRIGIVGGGALVEWAILPSLCGPDMATPPDAGAWWGRRAAPENDIAWQAPARVEIVAIADADVARLYRTSAAWRLRASFSNWREMLRETELDAIVAAPEANWNDGAELVSATREKNLWLWLDGPPAAASRELQFAAPRLWCAHPLNAAAAHRAARRLVESGRIGAVSSLALRWPRAFSPHADNSNFASTYAAFSLLLQFASSPPREGLRPRLPQAARVAASENGGAASIWLRFAHDLEGRALGATALFASGDGWNAALPRLEIAGTQGRAIVCEAGRRVVLTEPREAARTLEPPGLAPHVSQSNSIGIAEDLKEFLARVVREDEDKTAHGLAHAAASLRLIEAVRAAASSGAMIETDIARAGVPQPLPTGSIATEITTPAPLQPVLRLPLHS